MVAEVSLENRRLLNPAFTGGLLVRAAYGYRREAHTDLPYIYAYLILPLVLHTQTRERLPNAVVTRLPTWAERNGDLTALISKRAGEFALATRDAIFLITTTGLAGLDDRAKIIPLLPERKLLNFEKGTISPEVTACFHKANFVGRWLATSGTVPTVMTVLGVQL
ncbi:MAG TPA: three component ABC system middle component [Tepidisphaeraceae bacterium]|nr:three component ABC system middle component [Tepidisphaeraceae bacterium]